MKTNKFTCKKKATTKKKTATETKKVIKAAGKKNNKKSKKTDHLAIINEVEEAIILLFQDIDYGDPNKVEA